MAMDYYQGRPFGNEVEGRSSVVSTDVRDTIEWIMPTLMRIFTSGEQVVEFEPEGIEDEQRAVQATEYCQYIWMRDNPGYTNFYVWFKDGLMQKNGVVKIYFDESEETKRERYTGLDEQAFTELVNDDTVTVSEHTEREETIEQPVPDPKTGQLVIQNVPSEVHDVVITRTQPRRRVAVEPMPPEEFLISRDARDIQTARFAGHRKRWTLSDIRSKLLGTLKPAAVEEIMEQLSGDADTTPINLEEVSRNTVENYTPSANIENSAMALAWVTECYVKADVDGDGIAEMRKVTVAGPGHVIVSEEAWDGPRPFAALTPILMPHRFWGVSVADLVLDIQLIRSTLLRQYLDNLYLSNNARLEVVAHNIIDPAEVLTSRPGGAIRVKAAGSVTPIAVQPIGAEALQGLQYIDQIRENRTGVSERTQGLGANDLHETASGEQMLMSAAMGKIELIARTYAETGVKDAFKLILGLIVRYQNKPRTIRLTGKWVEMDPRSWNDGMDLSVSVGLGTGDNQQRLQHAMMLGQMQMQAGQSGVLTVTPDNAMETANLAVNAMGLKKAERFFSKPDPSKPPPPDPRMAKVMADAQLGQAKLQSQTQLQAAKTQSDAAVAQAKAQADMQTQQNRARMEAQVDHLHNLMEAQREQQKIQSDAMLQRMELNMKTALELQLAHIKGAVAIEVARIGAKADDGAAAYAKESAGE